MGSSSSTTMVAPSHRGEASTAKVQLCRDRSLLLRHQVLDIAPRSSPRNAVSSKSPTSTAYSTGQLYVEVMGRGFAWLDTGTHLPLQASQYVEILEQRQGVRLACPEEIAFRLSRFLSTISELAKRTGKSGYREYPKWAPAFARVNSFRRLWVVQMMAHSARTFSTPRNRNWRKPRACLICPNTGSTTCFLNR